MLGKVVGKQRRRLGLSASPSSGSSSSSRACRQLAMRAQEPGQRPHPCVSGRRGTERLLPQERRGEPCPCPLPGMLRAQDLGEVGCPASIGPLNAPSGSLAPGGGNLPLLPATHPGSTGRRGGRAAPACTGGVWQGAPGCPTATPVAPETTSGVCPNSSLRSPN